MKKRRKKTVSGFIPGGSDIVTLALLVGGGYVLYRVFKKDIHKFIKKNVPGIDTAKEIVKTVVEIPEKVESRAVKALETWKEPKTFTGDVLKYMRLNFSPYSYFEADHFKRDTGSHYYIKVPRVVYMLSQIHPLKFQMFSKNARMKLAGWLNVYAYAIDQDYKMHVIYIPVSDALAYSKSQERPVFKKKGTDYYIKVGGQGNAITFQSYNFYRILNNARRDSNCPITESDIESTAEALSNEIKNEDQGINKIYERMLENYKSYINRGCEKNFPQFIFFLKDVIKDSRKIVFAPETLNVGTDLPDWIDTDIIGYTTDQEKSLNYLMALATVQYIALSTGRTFEEAKMAYIDYQNYKWDTENPDMIMGEMMKGDFRDKIQGIVEQGVNGWTIELIKQIKADTELQKDEKFMG